jgi:hypothetical protein
VAWKDYQLFNYPSPHQVKVIKNTTVFTFNQFNRSLYEIQKPDFTAQMVGYLPAMTQLLSHYPLDT